MRLFLDTNILVDLLAERPPHSRFAIELFDVAKKTDIQLFVSSHSIATTHFIMKKYNDENVLRKSLSALMDMVSVIQVDGDILQKSLRSKISDFEDAIQLMCAYSINGIDVVVTRNAKDFKGSLLPVLSADQVLKLVP